jgi:hypothetical protein
VRSLCFFLGGAKITRLWMAPWSPIVPGRNQPDSAPETAPRLDVLHKLLPQAQMSITYYRFCFNLELSTVSWTVSTLGSR